MGPGGIGTGKVFTREIHSLIMGRSKADSAQVLLDVYGPDFPVQKVIDRQTPLFFEALQTEQIPAKKGCFPCWMRWNSAA